MGGCLYLDNTKRCLSVEPGAGFFPKGRKGPFPTPHHQPSCGWSRVSESGRLRREGPGGGRWSFRYPGSSPDLGHIQHFELGTEMGAFTGPQQQPFLFHVQGLPHVQHATIIKLEWDQGKILHAQKGMHQPKVAGGIPGY